MGALQFTATSSALAVPAAASPTAVAMPAFASNAQQVRITNPAGGHGHVHVAFGDSGVVASATSPYIVDAGSSAIFTIAKTTHVSAFSATSTPTINLVLGYGE